MIFLYYTLRYTPFLYLNASRFNFFKMLNVLPELKFIAKNLKSLYVFCFISGWDLHAILWWLGFSAYTFCFLMRLQRLIHSGKLFLSNIVHLIYVLILIINKNISYFKMENILMVHGLLKCLCSDILQQGAIKGFILDLNTNNEGHFVLVSQLLPRTGRI